MHYSKSKNAFYLSRIHGNSMPSDAVEIPDDLYNSVLAGQSNGLQILPDENGLPHAVAVASDPISVLQDRAKSELRTMRAPMLDRLTGIAGRATRAGNDALAAEADALAYLLLGITDDQALNAATTYEEMQAAGLAAYKRIAGSVRQELKVVFREVTGV